MKRVGAYPATRVIIEFYESKNHECGCRPGTAEEMPRKQMEILVPMPLLPDTVERIAYMATASVITGDMEEVKKVIGFDEYCVSIVKMEGMPKVKIAIEREE